MNKNHVQLKPETFSLSQIKILPFIHQIKFLPIIISTATSRVKGFFFIWTH